jgi:hypothetical protein
MEKHSKVKNNKLNMKTINDIKSLIINLFRSIPFKFRIHIPFLISISIIGYGFLVPSLRFWRETVGYNLLGMTYFVSIFSIINIMELKKIDLVSKNIKIFSKVIKTKVIFYLENSFFVLLYLFTVRIYTARTGLFGKRGTYDLSEGVYPFLKILIIFLVIIFIINRKKLNQNNKV